MLVVKNPPVNAGDIRDLGSIPSSGRSPGGGHGNPLKYCLLENPMDRGAWLATVHGGHRESVRYDWSDLALTDTIMNMKNLNIKFMHTLAFYPKLLFKNSALLHFSGKIKAYKNNLSQKYSYQGSLTSVHSLLTAFISGPMLKPQYLPFSSTG